MWYVIGAIVIIVVVAVLFVGRKKPKGTGAKEEFKPEEEKPEEFMPKEATEGPVETPSEEEPIKEEDSLPPTDENQPLP